jgi:hypothetical protein
MMRTSAKGISKFGRATKGVRVVKLRDSDRLSSVAKVISEEEEEKEAEQEAEKGAGKQAATQPQAAETAGEEME